MKVELKAIDLDAGQFEGYAAVFGNKDSYGDVIIPGAFADTLAEDYGSDGKGVPTYWCHDFTDPFKNIGTTLWAREDSKGLRVRVQLDLDTQNAKQTLKLLKEGRVNQMSFGYSVIEGAFVESEELGFFYELRKLKLHEVSVVPIGANQETEILAAKSDTTAGDGLDGVLELLKSAAESLSLARGAYMLAAGAIKAAGIAIPAEMAEQLPTEQVGEAESDSSSEEEPSNANPEEPEGANGEEPSEANAQTADEALALIALAEAGVHIETERS